MAAYAAIASFNRKISTIINFYDVLFDPPYLATLKFVTTELKSFQKFVERLDRKSRKRMNGSLARITEAIHNFDIAFSSSNLTKYEDLSRETHSLVKKLKKVEEEYYALRNDDDETHVSSSSRVVSKSKMVGLLDQRRLLKDDVMAPNVEKAAYLVTGMVGIGKTALAREVFDDLDVSEWFDCRAWVTVGMEWKSEEITEAILAQVDTEAHRMIMGGYEEEIGERLKENLKGKRYFIVLDDVWDILNVNNYLQSSFPDNQNGNLVLLTTRMKLLGVTLSLAGSIDMRLLDEKESWDLLREKGFAGVSCPPQLEEAGKKIAEKCDGLPLTIVTIVGLLSKGPESLWIDVAAKKKHQVFVDAYDQISEVLYPNYNILDDDLKLCFLYMGAFPEKYKIPISRLINLWVAEDFSKPHKEETLELCALENLEALDLYGFIMVYKRSTIRSSLILTASVKTCGLHSVWWHLCRKEARETNIFHVLDCYHNKDDLEAGIKDQSRLSIHNNVLFALKDVYESIEKICARCALSLLCFGPYSQYMVPVCFGLKFLRRLDALNIRFYDFPLEVLELVMLRYLALTCNRQLPRSISKLEKLQYLIVHPHLSIKSRGALSCYMPIEIWDLEELKHLEVMGHDLPDLIGTSLLKLLTLSDVTTESCIILNKVPNLTKLGIRIELAPDATEPLSCFDHIFHLSKLESLKCVIVNPEFNLEVASPLGPFPCLSFSLIKLSLSGIGYPWEEMSKVASLPNLEVLKLRYNAFRGPYWEVEEGGFPKLDCLLIESIDLVKLTWAFGSFKNLDVLRIKHCYKLKKLDLGDLPNIVEIEVVDCNPLVEWHAKHCALLNFDILRLPVLSSWKS